MKSLCDRCWKSVVVVLVLSLSGCAGERIVTRIFPQENILSPAEMQSLPEKTNPNNYVVLLDEGESIPLVLNFESDIALLVQDHVDLQLKQRVYFRLQGPENMTEEDWRLLELLEGSDFTKLDQKTKEDFLKHYTFYVSRDAVHWAPITDGKACKEVFGIAGGELSIGLAAGAKSGIKAKVTVKTHSVVNE